MAKLKIDPKLKQQCLDSCSLTELYQQAGTTRRQASAAGSAALRASSNLYAAAAANQAAAMAAAQGKLTYQQLVASKPMQRACSVVTQQLLQYMEQLYKLSSNAQQHVFEIVLLVDNSGSMVRLVDETKHAMVLVAEVLRRLEVKFAIVRFGRAHGQLVLKGLDDPFSAQTMQLALEALTCDEGTYPASACHFVATDVFKDASANASESPTLHAGKSSLSRAGTAAAADVALAAVATSGGLKHHRLILAIVDGLTQETRAEVSSVRRPVLLLGGLRLLLQHSVPLHASLSCSTWHVWS
jgi:hypothetical protein